MGGQRGRRRSEAGTARPRVLLVDDDASVLKSVSRLLAADFEILAGVTNGREAVESASDLDPDVVVLDITMPGQNGVETARELKRLESRAKVVFLTARDEDEYVAQAMHSGANGYVLKLRAWSDLPIALHQALEERQFLPSLKPLVSASSSSHSVQFHEDDSAWLDHAADILTASLRHD